MVLTGEGYRIIDAESAERALDVLGHPGQPVDLVILDLKLPGMSGLEAANTRAYVIFRQEGAGWQREDETHVLRGYALQAVGALLQRTGFRVQTVINPLFDTFDPYADETGQAIFLAVKERNL